MGNTCSDYDYKKDLSDLKLTAKTSFWMSEEDIRSNVREAFRKGAIKYKIESDFIKASHAFRCATKISKNDPLYLIEDMTDLLSMLMKVDDFDAAYDTANELVQIYMSGVVKSYDEKMANVYKIFGMWKPTTSITDDQRKKQIFCLEQAIKLYKNCDTHRTDIRNMYLIIAEHQIDKSNYLVASKIYKSIAETGMDDNLLRTQASKYFSLYLLCLIAEVRADNLMEKIDDLKMKFEEVEEWDTQFNEYNSSHILISSIIESLENDDIVLYDKAIRTYGEICAIDNIKHKLLLAGRNVFDNAR